MSITNLQQNIQNRQLKIYNCAMPVFDPDKFADWLTESFEHSKYKSYSALADAAGLSRSSVSALAGAKKQPLTDKPSQPKIQTVLSLVKALEEDENVALNLAGYASDTSNKYPQNEEELIEALKKYAITEWRVPESQIGKLDEEYFKGIIDAIEERMKGKLIKMDE